MKNIFQIFLFFCLIFLVISCASKYDPQKYINKPISVESITREMKCENCGMNLHKYLLTNHAFKLSNGDSHFFCSINCSTIALDGLYNNVETIYTVDHNNTKFIKAQSAFYVVGSRLKGTMTNVSKFTFANKDNAKSFMTTFSGDSLVNYNSALKMTRNEIKERKN